MNCFVILLNYPVILTGSVSFADTLFGKPNSTVHYGSVQCTGSEAKLTNCATNKLTFELGKQLVEHIGVAGVSCNIKCPSPTPIVCPTTQCPTTQCPTTQYPPVTVVQTVTDYKVTSNPQITQQAQPASLSESGHTLTTFLLTGLSGILGTVTVALGVG